MNNNEKLRQQVKILKALQNVSYKEFAEYLEIKQQSFYNWLKGSYDLSFKKQIKLQEIIITLKEN